MTLGSSIAYVTGAALQEMGLPAGTATVLAAIVSGGIIYSAGRYFLKDEAGNVIAEYTGEELDRILKGEMDDILPEISAVKGKAVDEAIEGSVDASLKNINEFVQGNRSFDDVLDDYAKVYADKINSNRAWSWDDTILGGDNLSKKQRNIIKQQAVDAGLIPNIDVTKVDGMRYGFADFESAGIVKETKYLPENMWGMTDAEQFKWLNEQIGGAVEGYTWHHTEIPGKMQLVPTGIHNVTTHNGGRTAGMWADAPR